MFFWIGLVGLSILTVNIIKRLQFGESYFEMFGRHLRYIPYIDAKYKVDINKEENHFLEKVKSQWKLFGPQHTVIPDQGLDEMELIELIEKYSKITHDNVKDKQLSGTIYSNSMIDDHEYREDQSTIYELPSLDSNMLSREINNYETEKYSIGNGYDDDEKNHSRKLGRLYTKAFHESYLWNSLHDNEFGIGAYLEYQVVHMVADMFGGDMNVKGFVTSGGTESLMLAMRCYRNYGMQVRNHAPGESIILASKSVHAAVLKAGQAYLIKIILVNVDEQERIDLDDLKYKLKKHGNKVVAIVGSSPSYPMGVIDPIEKMSVLASIYRCGLHIDCCLGGFIINHILQHKSTAGNYLSLQGVTSLSADTHKNGLAPKGSSVLVTKQIQNIDLAYYSIYSFPEWSGGVYGTPKDAGSQSCVHTLTALIAMLATGKKGYEKIANDIHRDATKMADVIKLFPEQLTLIAEPEVNVVAFKINNESEFPKGAIYGLAHEMSRHNFILNTLNGECVHFCVTMRFTADPTAIDRFRQALIDSLDAVQDMAEKGMKFPGDAGMYCALEAATSPKLEDLSYQKYIENCLLGKTGSKDAIKAYFLAHMNPYA